MKLSVFKVRLSITLEAGRYNENDNYSDIIFLDKTISTVRQMSDNVYAPKAEQNSFERRHTDHLSARLKVQTPAHRSRSRNHQTTQ